MKPVRWFLPAVALLAGASGLLADSAAAPNFAAYNAWPNRQGVLGMPLGSFAVIEGTERATSKFVGSDDFVVTRVNGITPSHPVTLSISDASRRERHLKPGTHYILHGWESGLWEGQPDELPSSAEEGWTQGGRFVFRHTFEISSIGSADGVPAPDARPVDPNALLKPDFSKPPDAARPIGIVGLPLGTFVNIKARRTDRTVMSGGNFTLVSVEGVPAPDNLFLTIENVKCKDGDVVSLKGYEAAKWGSTPDLPRSEDPNGGEAQQSFQIYHQFHVIQCQ